eukprot:7472669-Pyramimonas_sp.AAC.1
MRSPYGGGPRRLLGGFREARKAVPGECPREQDEGVYAEVLVGGEPGGEARRGGPSKKARAVNALLS